MPMSVVTNRLVFAARLRRKLYLVMLLLLLGFVVILFVSSLGGKESQRGVDTCAVPDIWTVFVTVEHPRMCGVRSMIDIGCHSIFFPFFAPLDKMAEVGGVNSQAVSFLSPDEKWHCFFVKP